MAPKTWLMAAGLAAALLAQPYAGTARAEVTELRMATQFGIGAMISNAGEINNHFSAPPFQYVAAKAPHVRRITTAEEILGGSSSYMVAYTTEKFRNENPKTYAAYVAALQEAIDYINKDPASAAKDYLEASKDPITVEEAVTMMKDPGSKFTRAPERVTTFANFMHKQGLIKVRPDSWKDMFFPDLHGAPGS